MDFRSVICAKDRERERARELEIDREREKEGGKKKTLKSHNFTVGEISLLNCVIIIISKENIAPTFRVEEM